MYAMSDLQKRGHADRVKGLGIVVSYSRYLPFIAGHIMVEDILQGYLRQRVFRDRTRGK